MDATTTVGLMAEMRAQTFAGRTLAEAHEEVSRELQVRVRCFPRWVQEGRIGQAESKDRLERLQAAQKFLQLLLDSEKWAV